MSNRTVRRPLGECYLSDHFGFDPVSLPQAGILWHDCERIVTTCQIVELFPQVAAELESDAGANSTHTHVPLSKVSTQELLNVAPEKSRIRD
jgi:HD superfamily phosphohydrolase YqeK